MLKQPTCVSKTSTGWPSLFYHSLFSVVPEALPKLDTCIAFAKDVAYDCTLVMVAAAKNRTAHLKWLVQAGANVNAQDGLGLTALHYAVLSGSEDAVALLISLGASQSIRDKRNMTPKGYADLHKIKRILLLL